MKPAKVGICFENGITDLSFLKAVSERILHNCGVKPTFVSEIPARSGIIGSIPANARILFELRKADLVIFATDEDCSKKDGIKRADQITDKIKSVNPLYLTRSILAVASPHIEKWLLLDEDVVKHTYGLQGSKPLPNRKMSPKEQF